MEVLRLGFVGVCIFGREAAAEFGGVEDPIARGGLPVFHFCFSANEPSVTRVVIEKAFGFEFGGFLTAEIFLHDFERRVCFLD